MARSTLAVVTVRVVCTVVAAERGPGAGSRSMRDSGSEWSIRAFLRAYTGVRPPGLKSMATTMDPPSVRAYTLAETVSADYYPQTPPDFGSSQVRARSARCGGASAGCDPAIRETIMCRSRLDDRCGVLTVMYARVRSMR